MIDEATIQRAGRLLAKAAGEGSTVFLFGSHARGEATQSSDLDFLVIEPEVPDRCAEMVRLRRALDDPQIPTIPIDVMVVSERHAREWGNVKGTLTQAALSEGRQLPSDE